MANLWARIVPLVFLSLGATEPSHATRLACQGSNGERTLETAILSVPAGEESSLAAAVAKLAKESGSTVDEEVSQDIATGTVSDLLIVVSGDGNVTVTFEQMRGASLASIAVERSCGSANAPGWEGYWSNLATGLLRAGYDFNF